MNSVLSSGVFRLPSISSIRKAPADRGLEAPSPENAEATERDAGGGGGGAGHLVILNENIN